MAITTDDFNKIWASTSPLTPYEFSESNYKEGWNFIGGTPPSRQMWDFLQKNNDEKMQYLADNYLPLSGGTLTGDVKMNGGKTIHFALGGSAGSGGWICGVSSGLRIAAESYSSTQAGGRIELRGRNYATDAGKFDIIAVDNNNEKVLTGKPDGTLTWGGQPLLPVGIVQAFAGNTIPTGWLLCDGSAVSRTTYANLFACIGTTYGSGDGSTTFNVPNLIDKFVEGSATSGTEKSAGLPDITGVVEQLYGGVGTIKSGAFSDTEIGSRSLGVTSGGAMGAVNVIFSASDSNAIYGNSTTVQPPALTMRYIIKY